MEEEIKGSIRKKNRKGTATAGPDVTDSRIELQKAKNTQSASVQKENVLKAKSKASLELDSVLAEPAGKAKGVSSSSSQHSDVVAEASLSRQAQHDEQAHSASTEQNEKAAEALESQEAAVVLAEAPAPKDDMQGKAVTSKAIASRLGASEEKELGFESKLEQQEERRKAATKMFRKEESTENRSKIYQALNPRPLWYESRREKEEAQEDAADDDTVSPV